jgi:hypothetical protein
MFKEKAKTADAVGAALERLFSSTETARAGGVYRVECRDKDGNLKWVAESANLVVNAGLQDMNDKYFLGSTYTATWYIGLYGAASSNNPAASDTAALHPGWTEVTPYSNATRPACVFGSATNADPSVITNSLSPAQFNINATQVVGGAFLISNNVKGGTLGVLFSASDFQSPGDRSVASGDTLNVTYTFSLDAA